MQNNTAQDTYSYSCDSADSATSGSGPASPPPSAKIEYSELPPPPNTEVPNQYTLPQNCSPDLLRARNATLLLQRQKYTWLEDSLPRSALCRDSLPPLLAKLPKNAGMPASTHARLAWKRLSSNINNYIQLGLRSSTRPQSLNTYKNLCRFFPTKPRYMANWQADENFGLQRLTGVNPMQIEKYTNQELSKQLIEKTDEFLGQYTPSTSLSSLIDANRAFIVRYPLCLDQVVQSSVAQRVELLTGPICLFELKGEDQQQTLCPIAIELNSNNANPVFTPLSDKWAWQLAKAHVAAADAHYHEGIHHLLATHIVTEIIAVLLVRHLHPTHPIYQLLSPHLEPVFDINMRAKSNLLAVGGPIDCVFAAGIQGVLDTIRIVWNLNHTDKATGTRAYDWQKWSLKEDLLYRGFQLESEEIQIYFYKDDALAIHKAIEEFVRSIVNIWYNDNHKIINDIELNEWIEKVADHIPGFPKTIENNEKLVDILTQIIFNGTAQHAAVNNGQYDSYGFVPNAPGFVSGPLPDEDDVITENIFWQRMPKLNRALAQLSMATVLSTPTDNSILDVGRVPAFHPAINQKAADAVDKFHHRLTGIGRSIEERNSKFNIEYKYLHPYNVSSATDI